MRSIRGRSPTNGGAFEGFLSSILRMKTLLNFSGPGQKFRHFFYALAHLRCPSKVDLTFMPPLGMQGSHEKGRAVSAGISLTVLGADPLAMRSFVRCIEASRPLTLRLGQ